MKEITLPSGNKATLDDAAFEDVMELQTYLASEIKGIPEIKVENGLETGLEKIFIDLARYIPNMLLKKEFLGILYKCGKKCIVTGKSFAVNFSPEYFEKKEHRPDFYPLMKEIAQYALAPFLQGLKGLDLAAIMKFLRG